jgi:hypothetical protein
MTTPGKNTQRLRSEAGTNGQHSGFNVMAKKPLRRSWTDEDNELLRQHILRGGSLARAAVKFDRSEQALRTQAKTLGLRFITVREVRQRITRAEDDARQI